MNAVDKAIETQLANIQTKTGQTLEQLVALVQSTGLTKHSEIRTRLISDLGLGYGDANALARYALQSTTTPTPSSEAPETSLTDEIYSGPKAALRPIHDRLLTVLNTLGPYETAPKKGYFSYRRKKQFAMCGPATNTRVELGLNMKDIAPTDRLVAMKPGEMCNYKIKLTSPEEIDQELITWLQQAYNSAG